MLAVLETQRDEESGRDGSATPEGPGGVAEMEEYKSGVGLGWMGGGWCWMGAEALEATLELGEGLAG